MGPPQRGLVHSAFASAANLLFADGFLLSLNASPAPSHDLSRSGAFSCMPNGLLLSASAGTWPFSAFKADMSVLLGAGRLVFEALPCSLDGSTCPRWNPHIEHPRWLDLALLRDNAHWLACFCHLHQPPTASILPENGENEDILALATKICGRGPGLTPAGDDFLAGWMAVGWLLYGPGSAFLAICQHITDLARQHTHILSQCWLDYAATGDVASPINQLLTALLNPDQTMLEQSASHVLALGATSGYDLIQGILYGIAAFPLF